MANKCAVCGKGPITGNKVSHANNRSRRTFHPNLHRTRAIVGGATVRIRVCTRCLRSGRVVKPPIKSGVPASVVKPYPAS